MYEVRDVLLTNLVNNNTSFQASRQLSSHILAASLSSYAFFAAQRKAVK
jgi:hypothetical protein